MLDDLIQSIDAKDSNGFVSFLSPECLFKFGNLPAVTGVEEIRQFVAGFFDSIDSLSHEITDSWEVPGRLACHGEVTYTRHDGSTLTVPFANIFKLDGEGIGEYRIFADTSQLYQ